MKAWLSQFLGSLQLSDVADVAIVATFLYAALLWLMRSTSRFMFLGTLLLAAVYLLARAFDLYLTTALFQGLFAVLLVALVVVFQEDIRRAFERVAFWGRWRSLRRPVWPTETETLVETAFNLAANRTGALIVLQGTERLERHLQGGTRLSAPVAESLLLSIFDRHSPGHDGAVVIANGELVAYACQLPLSRRHATIGTMGMRHSAAVGLSEVSDALVIVVSEERGTVGLAEGGTIETIGTPDVLTERLETFLNRLAPRTGRAIGKRLLTAHLGTKGLAICLACAAWLLVARRAETVQRSFTVPIEYRSVPPNMAVSGSTPTEAHVTFSGSERAFLLLDAQALRISLDIGAAGDGEDVFVIQDRDVVHPSNLTVFHVEPRAIRIALRKPN